MKISIPFLPQSPMTGTEKTKSQNMKDITHQFFMRILLQRVLM
jgi:hypothetical protein